LEASYEAFFLPDINNVMDVNIINLFEFPIYHVRNFAPEHRETCASNITNQYKERAYYIDNNPIKGEYWRRISLYDDKGVHAHTKGLDGIQGIPEWSIVKKQIKDHAIDYLHSFTDLKNTVLLKSLKEDWTDYSWWSCYAENDDYPWHHHANMFFTSCWFIQHDEKHAPLSFRSPLHSLINGWLPGDSKLKNEVVIKPEQGDLLIWPGWLEHEVPGPDAYIFYNKMEQGANKWQYDPDTIKYDQLRITLTCNLGKLHDSLTTHTREAI